MNNEPEFCPHCEASGDSTPRPGRGPDAWDEPCVCPRCKGAQTLRAAYDTLAEELPQLQLKVAQLGIFHSHATRYGGAPNQTDGMQSFAKLAAEWLAENAPPTAPQAVGEPKCSWADCPHGAKCVHAPPMAPPAVSEPVGVVLVRVKDGVSTKRP